MQGVRRLQADDVARVAELFQTVFRGQAAPAPPSLAAYIREVYLDHPSFTPDLCSLVSTREDGTIDGFIGILPLRMRHRGRPIQAAVAGALMVDRPRENPLAGARLLRAFLNGPQDLSYSDTANALSRSMWERLGGWMVPSLSLEWFQVFRPAGFALAYAGVKLKRMPTRLLRPAATLIDRTLGGMEPTRTASRREPSRWHDEPASDDELLTLIPRLADIHDLRPDWDQSTLRWLLHQARRKERYGPLASRIVRGARGDALGCYLYYGQVNGVAEVLQIFAAPGAAGSVIDALFAHAQESVCVGIRGKTEPALMPDLIRRGCYFRHPWSVVAHAKRAELARAVQTDSVMFGGLAGEWWTRFVSDSFH